MTHILHSLHIPSPQEARFELKLLSNEMLSGSDSDNMLLSAGLHTVQGSNPQQVTGRHIQFVISATHASSFMTCHCYVSLWAAVCPQELGSSPSP